MTLSHQLTVAAQHLLSRRSVWSWRKLNFFFSSLSFNNVGDRTEVPLSGLGSTFLSGSLLLVSKSVKENNYYDIHCSFYISRWQWNFSKCWHIINTCTSDGRANGYLLGTCKLDLFYVNITICSSIVASVVPVLGLFICQMLSCNKNKYMSNKMEKSWTFHTISADLVVLVHCYLGLTCRSQARKLVDLPYCNLLEMLTLLKTYLGIHLLF